MHGGHFVSGSMSYSNFTLMHRNVTTQKTSWSLQSTLKLAKPLATSVYVCVCVWVGECVCVCGCRVRVVGGWVREIRYTVLKNIW